MLQGINRLVSLVPTRSAELSGTSIAEIEEAVFRGDVARLSQTDGHFACVQRDGQKVRLARTIGFPLRYFVAKMFHGPFLVVGERMEQLYEWCCEQKIGWQFDPMYTRMVPAHVLTEIEQIGCPDPAPIYTRFFDPVVGQGPTDIDEVGAHYIQTTYAALKAWLGLIPDGEPIGLAFSGGIDSTSVFVLAREALEEMGRDPNLLRAFTLDLGEGKDAQQAESVVKELGLEANWERVSVPASTYDIEDAIACIEDYHPLDVECAAAGVALLRAVRERYPTLKYFLDGDGGDENLKSYPLEDSDLTLSSILRNPLLYQEGWGLDAIKHSLTYSGGLSRGYMRSYAPAARFGFEAFSPYTVRSVIAAALAIPFETVLAGSTERLYTLKGEVVAAGVKHVCGIDMPVYTKRRFQDGVGGESYRKWRVTKASCRQIFLKQWESRLREAWDPETDRISGNDETVPLPAGR
jgi:asparagine synthase (glutamine-hydrolysing)